MAQEHPQNARSTSPQRPEGNPNLSSSSSPSLLPKWRPPPPAHSPKIKLNYNEAILQTDKRRDSMDESTTQISKEDLSPPQTIVESPRCNSPGSNVSETNNSTSLTRSSEKHSQPLPNLNAPNNPNNPNNPLYRHHPRLRTPSFDQTLNTEQVYKRMQSSSGQKRKSNKTTKVPHAHFQTLRLKSSSYRSFFLAGHTTKTSSCSLTTQDSSTKSREAEVFKTKKDRSNFLSQLKRSKSLPFFNSWEYGNIDVDLQLDGIGK
jgi:hypothetical protein